MDKDLHLLLPPQGRTLFQVDIETGKLTALCYIAQALRDLRTVEAMRGVNEVREASCGEADAFDEDTFDPFIDLDTRGDVNSSDAQERQP